MLPGTGKGKQRKNATMLPWTGKVKQRTRRHNASWARRSKTTYKTPKCFLGPEKENNVQDARMLLE